jgi:hypothetical protein
VFSSIIATVVLFRDGRICENAQRFDTVPVAATFDGPWPPPQALSW